MQYFEIIFVLYFKIFIAYSAPCATYFYEERSIIVVCMALCLLSFENNEHFVCE